MQDPSLDAVKQEDKGLVTDVLRVTKGIKGCSTYNVNIVPKGYEVLAWFSGDDDMEISFEDLGIIEQVNQLRVKVMGVRINKEVQRACIRVRIISHSEPCMVNEAILYQVRKRSRWFCEGK